MLKWRAGLTPAQGLAAHDAAASLLAAGMRGMAPEAHCYHDQPTDAAGCAALHCDEVLVHGYDLALGRGGAGAPGGFRGPPLETYGRRCWGATAAWPCLPTLG